MVGRLRTRRGRQMLLAAVAKQSAGRTAKAAREPVIWQLKMLSISRDHPLVRTEGMAGLFRVEVYKEAGRRNRMPWPQEKPHAIATGETACHGHRKLAGIWG